VEGEGKGREEEEKGNGKDRSRPFRKFLDPSLLLLTQNNNHFQTFRCNYPYIDFAFLDFIVTPAILEPR